MTSRKSKKSKGKTASIGIAAIVADYIAKYRDSARSELNFFYKQPSLAEAITFAGQARINDVRHSHQRRRTQAALDRATKVLMTLEPRIASCKDFATLLELVEGSVGEIDDIGPLYEYDTALRIGARLRIGPKLVYLHAGTREGARAALGIGGREPSIKKGDLPAAFAVLDAREIEDCLCIYKEDLKAITQGVPVTHLVTRRGCRYGRPAPPARC